MSDLFLNFGDRGKPMDTSMGIPIPRSQHNQFLSPEYSQLCNQLDNDSFSPSCPPLVPPNSLVSHQSLFSALPSLEINQSNFSFMPPSSMLNLHDTNEFNDLEIKMEPIDEFLDIGLLNSHQRGPEENLLDDVNFEDLLIPDEMDTSTTCLDPQHSSPAAMAAVRPEDVFGHRSEYNSLSGSTFGFTPSISVPIKSESQAHTSNTSSTFPPQGIGWKDPFLSVGGTSQLMQTETLNPDTKNFQVQYMQTPSPIMQDHLDISNSYKCESPFSPVDSNSSALHDLLVNSPSECVSPHSNLSPSPQMHAIPIGQSVPGHQSFLAANSLLSSRLSSSAPTNNESLDMVWQRREPRRHLLSTGTLDEEMGGSTSSLSTGCGIMSPIPHDLSIDEGDAMDSDEDSEAEHYDSESDNDSLRSDDPGGFGVSSRKEKHFWQYNVQSKGPKGQRVNITKSETDPHQLEQVMDPVFSPVCSIQGIKHSGKARRGDGNDLTPSPRKLVTIGTELDKLNKKINDMTPVSELPNNIRTDSRKEKNKLASRACRLKKKAQHEANKIKLHGLNQEHRALMAIVHKVRLDLIKKGVIMQLKGDAHSPDQRLGSSPTEAAKAQQHLTYQIEKNSRNRAKLRIAGNTTEFVNKIIENCRGGNPTGGLDELLQTFLKTSLSGTELDQAGYS